MAANQYSRITAALNKNLEHLSTGKKINRASDDPSGMMTVTKLQTEREVIRAKMDRMEFQASYLGARDGAQSVVSDMLVELNGHIVTAANAGAMTADEREAIQIQVDSIISGIDNLALTSRFNNKQLLEGQQAANLGVQIDVTDNPDGTQTVTRFSLADLRTGGKLNLIDGDLTKAQEIVKGLTTSYSAQRAGIGAQMNSIDSEMRTLETQYINLTDAQSQIEDTDYAAEVSAMVRNQVLQQAAAYALRLAQSSGPKRIMSLLQNL